MTKIITGDRVGKLGKLTVGCSAAIFDTIHQRILLVLGALSSLITAIVMLRSQVFSKATAWVGRVTNIH